MPINPIIVDTTITPPLEVKPAWGNVGIVGRDTGGTATDNEVKECFNLGDVETYFGSGTDVYKAAEKVFEQGVLKLFAMRLGKVDVVNEAVSEGTVQVLANKPVLGRPVVSIVNSAGVSVTPIYVYGTPAADGEINMNTGEIFVAGVGMAAVSYSYVPDWTVIEQKLKEANINMLVMAMTYGDAQFYGEMLKWKSMVNTNNWIATISGNPTYAPATIVTDLAYYSSRNIVGVAHKDPVNDVAAAVTGCMATFVPWDKLMWTQIKGIAPAGYFTTTEVEDVLENGLVNAIIQKLDVNRMSDGLTLAGEPYKYIDITRTRYYMEDLITTQLSTMIATEHVPFTPVGILRVKSAIGSACETGVAVGALREPFYMGGVLQPSYKIQTPAFEDIPAEDKVNRILRNVLITIWLASHIQSITMNLNIQL